MKVKNGFTLVELLAVVVLLGIMMVISIPAVTRWIDRSKAESIESQRKTLLMAGESYAQANTGVLPKAIGNFVEITAKQLKEANFLTSDIINANKESCMAKSFVRIYKYDKTGYTYTAYIYCGNEERPEDVHINPSIQILFNGENPNNDNQYQNVSTSAVQIIIKGSKNSSGESIGLTSYRYVISVNYDSIDSPKVELFNSGDIVALGRAEVTINKDLTSFENYTSITNFNVYVEAYNQDGGYFDVYANSSYKDTTGPECGEIVGQAGEDEWDNTWRTKKISVACKDNNGSGCVKDVYTKTFREQAEYGTIQIADNAGNKTNCRVRVHLDWTTPTLTITAYKRNSDGTKGTQIATATANNSSQTKSITSYTGGNGDDSWLNNADFPYGVYYEVTAEDTIKIQTGTYSENAKNLKKTSGNVNTLTVKTTQNFTEENKKMNFSIVDEGFRKGKFVLTDAALNTVTINITAPIDRTNPSCETFTGQAEDNEWTADDSRTISVTCKDTISGCTKESFSKKFTAEAENGNISIGDNAGNTRNCSARVHLDRTAPTLKIVAYKRNSDGTKDIQVGTVTANNSNQTKSIDSYTNGNGSDSWLNNANFPYGIYYEVITNDNFVLNSGTYSENASGIKKDESGVDTLTSQFTNTGEGTNFSMVDEGFRKGKYVLKDAAGNKVTVNITAPIDRTKPVASASKSNLNKTSGVTVTLSCTDSISGCDNVEKTGVKSTTSYTISDRAGNVSDSISVTVTSQTQKRDCSEHEACDCTKSEKECAPDGWSRSCKVCATTSGTGSTSQCWTEPSCPGYPMSCDCSYSCNSYKDVCKEYSSADHCACAKWGSWYNVNSCSGNCRTIYY